jgi:serine protease Do
MKNTDLFDDYLSGRFNEDQKREFEARLQVDDVLANAYGEHKELTSSLAEYEQNIKFKEILKNIHAAEIGNEARIMSLKEPFGIRYGRAVMVAASTAVIAVLSTIAILGTGGYLYKKQKSQITELGLTLKASSNAIVEGISKGSQKNNYAPANMEGSAFALNNRGYIVTSYHIIKNSDSIFIENGNLNRAHTNVVFVEPKLDLAILKLENAEIAKTWQVPFYFNDKRTDVGERVYTIGYPRKDMVYGEGSLSSLSGYNNDTCMYQISIPVNPGNSGSPLLDDDGNVIGVIRGKITNAEATGFAVKSAQIISAIQAQSADSLLPSKNRKAVLRGLKRPEQIKKINPYVFNILVYKKD